MADRIVPFFSVCCQDYIGKNELVGDVLLPLRAPLGVAEGGVTVTGNGVDGGG